MASFGLYAAVREGLDSRLGPDTVTMLLSSQRLKENSRGPSAHVTLDEMEFAPQSLFTRKIAQKSSGL